MSFLKLKISIVGLGYIGLPTAAVLASVGHDVLGVDICSDIVDTVNRGDIHIVEADLKELVYQSVSSGRLRASLSVDAADVFVIAVPTPFKANREPDLAYVEKAACSIAPSLRAGSLVILESTSPVGSTEQLAAWLAAARPDLVFFGENADVDLAYCPERVLPGSIVSELIKNDRVIGGLTPRGARNAREFYETFVRGQCIETDARTAEMTKLTENAFRDVNIAFANELSIVCDELGIDVWELIALANRHPRVNILNPGPGVGGHCIAVDPWFIVDSAPETARLIRMAREVNDSKPDWVLEKISTLVAERRQAGGSVVVACLGLAFKANIDDLRESPALEIVERVVASKSADCLLVVEPYIEKLPVQIREHAELVSIDDALLRADIFVLLVDHQQFKSIDRGCLDNKAIIDTRGIWK